MIDRTLPPGTRFASQPDMFDGNLPFLQIVIPGEGTINLFGFNANVPEMVEAQLSAFAQWARCGYREFSGVDNENIYPPWISIQLMRTPPEPGPPILIDKIL